MVTPTGDRVVPAGKYNIFVGGGQPGEGIPTVSGEFAVTGEAKLPE
jgi:hypothetical protein